MPKKISWSKAMYNTRQQLKKFLPPRSEVELRFKKIPGGSVETVIEVTAPNIEFFAKKRDTNLVHALEKTRKAIIKQIQKRKINKKSLMPNMDFTIEPINLLH